MTDAQFILKSLRDAMNGLSTGKIKPAEANAMCNVSLTMIKVSQMQESLTGISANPTADKIAAFLQVRNNMRPVEISEELGMNLAEVKLILERDDRFLPKKGCYVLRVPSIAS